MENPQQDLFAVPEYHLVQARGGKRFANYIIDVLFLYALVILAAIVMAILNPVALDSFNEEDTGFNVVDQLAGLLLYALYMFAMEAIFKGKSLGKLITGTRAVNEDGTNVSPRAAMLRGLSRAVPFNAFSALGTPSFPWHDKWTNTYVIDEKKSNRPAS
ncbi:MAG: RDD family protein [Chitinophagaceae bacterium]